MFSGLFSSNSVARGLDYDAMVAHSFNLSGKVVSFSLPGGLDSDFPVKSGIAVANIYDKEKYSGDYYRPDLLERHWDYRGYFWQGLAGRYAMMNMLLSVGRVPENVFPDVASDMQGFEKIMIQRMHSEHEETNGIEYPISIRCNFITIGGRPALKCEKHDETPVWGLGVFIYAYFPILDNLFLKFTFKVSPLGDDKKDNRYKWHPQSLEDIDKIIASVRISGL